MPAASSGAICVGLALALLGPALYETQSRQLAVAKRLRNVSEGEDPANRHANSTMVRFAQSVRRNTPETAAFFDSKLKPEYGILVPPTYGHVFSFVARRATPATGFGPYLDAEKTASAHKFCGAGTTLEAMSEFDALGARYLVTRAESQGGAFVSFLHRYDGSSEETKQRIGQFRLVVEGPAGGRPFPSARLGKVEGVIPYKLFERVTGAVLAAQLPPGTRLMAEVEVETNLGRRFVYRAETTARPSGIAGLRLPYATDGNTATRAVGPYRVSTEESAERWVDVPEAAVLDGTMIDLGHLSRVSVAREHSAKHRQGVF
jgi:hypothetical protein